MREIFDNRLFYRSILLSFVLTLIVACIVVAVVDYKHPSLPCQDWEKEVWKGHSTDKSISFFRVSARFWSALCRDNVRPIIISGSDGPGGYLFTDGMFNAGYEFDQFMYAHRGTKTGGYILAHDIHPDRLKNLKMVLTISPMYFSKFAARTDGASIRLNALSTATFLLRFPSPHLTWNEFLPLSPFTAVKSYLDEVMPLLKGTDPSPETFELVKKELPERDPENTYNQERQMQNALLDNFKTFKSKTNSRMQPTRAFWDQIVETVNNVPELNTCVVMFPFNSANLRYFHHDTELLKREMTELIEQIPQDRRIDLLYMNEEPYIFRDPMHFTDFGKRRLIEEIVKSDCFKRMMGS